jgi:hypothetical protein
MAFKSIRSQFELRGARGSGMSSGMTLGLEILDTSFDLLRVSLSRNFGYTKGVTIAKFWIHFWIYSGRHYREILDTILNFFIGVIIAKFWIYF